MSSCYFIPFLVNHSSVFDPIFQNSKLSNVQNTLNVEGFGIWHNYNTIYVNIHYLQYMPFRLQSETEVNRVNFAGMKAQIATLI
ncbi:hypothetical protein SXCC_00382 [Gluconacetobacter sp. SXCC-1]|nr:hypothetical protein SXCC_00382 [Gluconacetobacter sp. SXCC-1]